MSTTVIKNYCVINENKASQDSVGVIRPPAPPARTRYPGGRITFRVIACYLSN